MRLLATHSPGFDPARPWRDETASLRGETRLFRQMSLRRHSPHTDRRHDFTRLECPDWVHVLAFTPQGELLAVEQFRHGIDASTLEGIGGVCDEGEAPLEAARRELLEETGHASDQWHSLGWCTPNPAVQDNRCHFFVALECRPVAELKLDPSEELQVWAVPWAQWQELVDKGEVHHALVLAALLRLQAWSGWDKLKEAIMDRHAGDDDGR
ncbi:MAG: NUDIX hydrolase [Firmicutes bacterium]|nr:NUDIX hydrolase [Bacillota bacterium]